MQQLFVPRALLGAGAWLGAASTLACYSPESTASYRPSPRSVDAVSVAPRTGGGLRCQQNEAHAKEVDRRSDDVPLFHKGGWFHSLLQ